MAITIAVMILALTAGCNIQVPEITDHTESSSVPSSQSTESIQSTQISEKSAKASYTMADIKKLKNTENFAKNTLEHIFDGTINGKGKATGYHYTKVTDSKGKIIDGTRSDVDENGVFTGKVDAINTAYNDAINDPNNPKGTLWIGYCDDLEIDMYLNSNNKITTAFPVYEGD